MDWSLFSRIPDRTVRNAQIVIKGVVGNDDKFYADDVAGQDGLQKTLTFLAHVTRRNGEPIKERTKKSYLSAISRLFSEIGMDGSLYRDKVTEIEKAELAKGITRTHSEGRRKAEEILHRLMHKCSKDIAVLAALIYYDCDIQTKEIARTRCDIDDDNSNFLDLDNSQLTIRKDGHKSKVLAVPSTFTAFVKSLNIKNWLLGMERKESAVSTMFKRASDCSIKELKTMFKTPDNDSEDSEMDLVYPSPSPVEVPTVEVPLAVGGGNDIPSLPPAKPKIKVVIKPRPKSSVSDGIEWDKLADPNCSESTNNTRKGDVIRLQSALVDKSDMFFHSAFAGKSAYDKVKAYLHDKAFSLNTQCKYLAGLCKMLESSNCGVADFRPYELLYKATVNSIKSNTDVPETVTDPDIANPVKFTDLLLKSHEVFSDPDRHHSVRLFALLMIESEDWKADTAIGLLRVSDLIRMKFIDDGGSHIDINRRLMIITEDQTKNNTARQIHLSSNFISGLDIIYGSQKPEWVIMSRNGEPYKTPNGVREYMSDAFGCTPKVIRSSYATYLHDLNIPMPAFRRICHNMGHSHRISVTDYIVT